MMMKRWQREISLVGYWRRQDNEQTEKSGHLHGEDDMVNEVAPVKNRTRYGDRRKLMGNWRTDNIEEFSKTKHCENETRRVNRYEEQRCSYWKEWKRVEMMPTRSLDNETVMREWSERNNDKYHDKERAKMVWWQRIREVETATKTLWWRIGDGNRAKIEIRRRKWLRRNGGNETATNIQHQTKSDVITAMIDGDEE